jgi:hypothetical protein
LKEDDDLENESEMGRPRKEFSTHDWKLIDTALQFKQEATQVADLLDDCSARTLARRIREKYNLTFVQYRDKRMSKTLHNLFSKQYEVAMAGNVTMLIWLGKNYLNQTDKNEISAADASIPIQVTIQERPKSVE